MIRRHFSSWFIPVLLLLVFVFAVDAQAAGTNPAQAAVQSGQTPKGPRPEQFTYPPLNFKVPKASEFRTKLSNGLVVYIAEDHEIPWFSASLLVRTGPFLEPKDKLGVDGFAGSIMRSGGSTTMTGEQINERMDFLAGTVTARNLSINIKYLDEGLKIWMDILTNPAFPDDKLRREKDQALPAIRNRNKNVSEVAGRVYSDLIYGENSPITQETTEATITGITRADLIAWHKKYWGANNAILVVSGDFKKAEMMKKLEATVGKWPKAEKAVPPIPKVQQASKAGVYMVQPEVIPNQGIIRIGHLGLMVDDPDYAAVDLMNYILGGGSFSSRITKVVRTDNGLAYSTSSSFSGGGGGGPRGGGGGGGAGILYPGTFTASCQTKNSTVVFASQLMLDLIEGMHNGDVSEADLKMAKSARVNAFPSMFSGVGSIIQNFANLEFTGRPMNYYDAYLAKYEKVTVADLKRVAQKWLQPDKMIIMVAGNIEECKAGANNMLPNQPTIDAMAAKFGGRTIDGLAKKYGAGTVHIVKLK
ncbi:MAG: pitrilysin family protein [Candidatus Aminicenantes bacterium]|nr:pitrilysin family protein [Candidatus Aminicenantes bacterium]